MIKVPVVVTVAGKGLKQAEGALKKLGKGFDKLGLRSKVSLAAAVTGLSLLTKKSLAAAIAQEKANKSLQTTLNNIGKSSALKGVLEFTDALQRSSGVSEDKLQPALQKLLNTTENVTIAQELLKRALDISAGSGNSLETVVSAISKAYSGNVSALGRLNLGLDKTVIESGNLSVIMEELRQKFGGQTQAAADTLSRKIDKLKISASEASETFGEKLIVAFEQFNADGNKSLDGIGKGLETFAERGGNAVIGIGALINDVKIGLGVLNEQTGGFLGKLAQALSPLGLAFSYLEKRGKETAAALELANALQSSRADTKGLALNKQRVAQEEAYIDAIAEGVDLDKVNLFTAIQTAKIAADRVISASKLVRIDKQGLQVKRLALKFDEQNIQIQAALKNKLSKEDLARVKALQAAASEAKDDDYKALVALEEAQKKAADAEIANRKRVSEANAAAIEEQKSQFAALQEWLTNNPIKIYSQYTNTSGQLVTAPGDFGLGTTAPVQKKSVAPTIVLNTGDTNASNPPPATNANPAAAGASNLQYGTYGATGNITVNVNAGAVADENKLTYIIADQIVKYVRFGGTTAPAGFI